MFKSGQTDIARAHLPEEVTITHILLKMPIKAAISLLQVCKQFRKIDENTNFWKAMLETHFHDHFKALLANGDKKDLTQDYKRLFKHLFNVKTVGQLYDARIIVYDQISTDPTKELNKFFQELTIIFNKNINKTNPGPHIHITPEGGSLKYNATLGGFYGTIKLALPDSFPLIYDELESSGDNHAIYYPGAEISCAHIISCEDTFSQFPLCKNPLGKRKIAPEKILSLAEIKHLLKAVCNITEQQLNYKIGETPVIGKITQTMFKKIFDTPKSNVELNKELLHAIEKSIDMLSFLSEVHKINHNAVDISIDELVKRLNVFFKAIGIPNYNRNDDKEVFLKKCQTANLISTVPLDEIKSALGPA